MPEIPDFESIARQVAIDGGVTGITALVAAQLRQVWNARGAADIARLEDILQGQTFVDDVIYAIQQVDR